MLHQIVEPREPGNLDATPIAHKHFDILKHNVVEAAFSEMIITALIPQHLSALGTYSALCRSDHLDY